MPADPPSPPAPPVTRPDDGQGAVVVERKPQKTEPPRMYQVVLLNDDYTPMEFVVMVLQEYFSRDLETAQRHSSPTNRRTAPYISVCRAFLRASSDMSAAAVFSQI